MRKDLWRNRIFTGAVLTFSEKLLPEKTNDILKTGFLSYLLNAAIKGTYDAFSSANKSKTAYTRFLTKYIPAVDIVALVGALSLPAYQEWCGEDSDINYLKIPVFATFITIFLAKLLLNINQAEIFEGLHSLVFLGSLTAALYTTVTHNADLEANIILGAGIFSAAKDFLQIPKISSCLSYLFCCGQKPNREEESLLELNGSDKEMESVVYTGD